MHVTAPHTASDRSGWLAASTGIFLAWALFALVIRVWVRLKARRQWGNDDNAVALSFILATGEAAAMFAALHLGFGQHYDALTDEQRDRIEKALFAGQILYVWSMGLSRSSTALFLGRLSQYTPQSTTGKCLFGACVVWTVASTLLLGIRGTLSRPWADADGGEVMFVRWLIIECLGTLLEFSFFAQSCRIVLKLNMSVLLRITLVLVFAARLVTLGFVGLRLHFLMPSINTDIMFSAIIAAIYTQAVMYYSIISASIPIMRPFMRAFDAGVAAEAIGNAWGEDANSSGLGILRSSTSRQTRYGDSIFRYNNPPDGRSKEKSPRVTGREVIGSDRGLRPDCSNITTFTESGNTLDRKELDSGVDMSEQHLQEDEMVIRQTITFSLEQKPIDPDRKPKPNCGMSGWQ